MEIPLKPLSRFRGPLLIALEPRFPVPSTVQALVAPARIARWIFACCLVLEIAFVLLDYHVNYGRLSEVGAIRRLTNIAREDGLASWFGTTQTLLVALTAWGILLLTRAAHAPVWRRGGWLIVAITFTYMAVDDGAQLHERLGTLSSALQTGGGPSLLNLFPSYSWQVLFVPGFGLFGVILAVFLWYELNDRAAMWLVLSALTCFTIAVGLDFVEGLNQGHPWNLYTWIVERVDLADFTTTRFRQPPYDTLEHFSRSLEEFLEMLANTFLWVTFLRHVPSVVSNIHVRVTT